MYPRFCSIFSSSNLPIIIDRNDGTEHFKKWTGMRIYRRKYILEANIGSEANHQGHHICLKYSEKYSCTIIIFKISLIDRK